MSTTEVWLEWWHPDGLRRWSGRHRVVLPVTPHGEEVPMPGWPSLRALAPFMGPEAWVVRLRQRADGLVAMIADAEPPAAGAWEPVPWPESRAPWSRPGWREATAAWIARVVGPHRAVQHRVWGRSTVWRIEAGDRVCWFKESYGLPPGEGAALRLASSTLEAGSGLQVPEVFAAEGPRVLMAPFQGEPLLERPTEDWVVALQAALRFATTADVGAWREAGAVDATPATWHDRLTALFAAYGLADHDVAPWAARFEALPEGLSEGVLPHDLGPCNLRWLGDGRVQGFDWADVVIGTPGMLVDRFLNEVRPDDVARRDALTAVLDPGAWGAVRRVALLQEVWRYHRELAWLDGDAPVALKFRKVNGEQLRRQLGIELT